jgi:hypothetical protein
MLDKVSFKLSYSQISGFMLEKEYTNFLTLQQVISDLQEAELIKTDAMSSRTFFSITPEGQNMLTYFGNRISDSIKQEIETFLLDKNLELKNEAAITATYYKSTSGEYVSELVAKEKDIDLVNIKLSVPTKDMAETLCDSWYNKNQQIYKYLMEELF